MRTFIILLLAVTVAATSWSLLSAGSNQEPQPQTPQFGEMSLGKAEIESIPELELTIDGEVVRFDRQLSLHGTGFFGTSVGPFVHFDGTELRVVEMVSKELVTALVPVGMTGVGKVRVTNPDDNSVELPFNL